MKRYIKNTVLPVAMFVALLLTSCNEHYLKYDTSHNGVYFTKDTLNYSFGVMPVEYKAHTYNIPVAIMGTVSKEKRQISYEILPDSTTAVNGVHYTIGEACVMPDSIVGYIPVTMYRNTLEGDHKKGYTRYKLALQLVENNSFTPTLDAAHQVRIFRFDNVVEQPEWLNSAGEKVWSLETLGKWHPLKLIKMVEYYHAIDTIQPETYKKMVVLYGENLEHIKGGYPIDYKTTFDKYIYAPMYEYFADPANRDEIISEYPQFPFDFPNPYDR